MRIVIVEHFIQCAPLSEEVDQQHGPGLRFLSCDLQRLTSNVGQAFADDGYGSAVAEGPTRNGDGPVGIPHGTPSKTQ